MQKILGRIVLIGFGSLMLLIGVRCLIGFVYHLTSKEDTFVCQSSFCLKRGNPIPFQTTRGSIFNVYACEAHPPPRLTKNYGLEQPSLTSFLFALGIVIIPILIFRKMAKKQSQPDVPKSSQTSAGLVETLDDAAEKAGGSVTVLFRRYFVNIICLTALIIPILLVVDQNLNKPVELVLPVVALGICVMCFSVASRLEKEYSEDQELHDEMNSFTFKLFVKRTTNWGWFIYGLGGVLGIIDAFSKVA